MRLRAVVNSLLKSLITGALLAYFSGCSSATFSVKSNPENADIYVGKLGTEKLTLLGKTPFTGPVNRLGSAAQGPGPVIVEIRKEGFQPIRTIITDVSISDLSLSIELPNDLTFEQMDSLNQAIDELFEGQRLARAGRYDDALVAVHNVQKEKPQLSASYELEAGIYFLQKKYHEALDASNKALTFNPKNPSSIKMRELLVARLGNSTPPKGPDGGVKQ